MAYIWEDDKINASKAVCKEFFDGKGLTVYFDTPISEEIGWRPHIFATNEQNLILDILTLEKIPNFFIKKYAEIRNALRDVEIYIGLVGDLNYFPDVISMCARNGLGIYKINNTMKLLFKAKPTTIEALSSKGQIAVVFGRPYKNILALKKCLRSCRSHLYWFERNLPKKTFEILFEAIEDGDIQQVETIRFLRGIDDKINEGFRDEFLKFRKDIHTHDIESQLRIICESSIANRVHGRYIYTKDEQNEPVSIKLPPLNSLRANQWDTILTDTAEIPSFQEFWDNGLDIQHAWNDIKRKVNEYCQRRAPQLEEQARALRARSEPTKST